MSGTEIPDSAISAIARHINERSNKEFYIPVIGNESNLETPQVFEIIPFDQIDNSQRRFYALDGSYNSEQFYNGLSVGIYAGGYVCSKKSMVLFSLAKSVTVEEKQTTSVLLKIF